MTTTLIDASTNLQRRLNEDLGKHFDLSRQENGLLSHLLLSNEGDEMADKCLFNLEETGSRWTEEQLLYLIDLLDDFRQSAAADRLNTALAEDAYRQIGTYL